MSVRVPAHGCTATTGTHSPGIRARVQPSARVEPTPGRLVPRARQAAHRKPSPAAGATVAGMSAARFERGTGRSDHVNLNRISGGSYLGAIARSIDDSRTDARAAQLRARLARVPQTIIERRRQLDDARIDVFSAMEHMS